ncbi:aminodeoxychorismate synthase component I [Xenorhabdus bovienii]|uniref:aminodeoxychorismate synthase n=1 Tax=Xenorhabdus bovienii TaxID=40576 RepID=A0AAJ1N6W7_XENBV|nr:aminodeoxychorismate synthase component I [Xenorhabdus bovienii]MDE1480176.1 aminodeoxychorismate synthase component I [Xenorhabdus bovienii]MDE9511887.1 aminodeoxychorismate synthase component I [Xenorhabdus bovienii]MDE9523529.1 aminodeoxychorismate synthase component I [Xenorhabdus bovienii]
MKILLIDNYDSFTQNIAQYLYEVTGVEPVVVTNSVSYDELFIDNYDAIVISPGPGHPSVFDDFGVCSEVIKNSNIPLLGICLGHQGIVLSFGGTVEHAPKPIHGYRDTINHTKDGLFYNLPERFEVVRYHSLICNNLPNDLKCSAWTDDGLVMAVEHKTKPIFGVQFHPESIDSEHGHDILRNFINIVKKNSNKTKVNCCSVIDSYLMIGGNFHYNLNYRECKMEIDSELFFEHNFSNDSYSFWLDSENHNSPKSRFSIMGGYNPSQSIIIKYNIKTKTLNMIGPDGEICIQGDFFSQLSILLEEIEISTPNETPFRFKGGFIGYLGYELKSLTIGEEKHNSEYPDSILIFNPHFFVFDHSTEKIYECILLPCGKYLEWPEKNIPIGNNKEKKNFPDFHPGIVEYGQISLDESQEEYINKIEKILQYIKDGESYEVCLTNKAKMYPTIPPFDAYKRMRHISPVPYGAYLSCGNFHILSASPETFLSIDSTRNIESRPIKGTRARGKTREEDLLLWNDLNNSKKDRAENLMIVDLVRHDLNQVCNLGSVCVPEKFKIESFSSVHQLVSTIRGKLKDNRPIMEAVRACFPGGSMTGAPKKRTMEIIDSLESSARGIYSGALGWFSFNGEVELSIVIRTAILRGKYVEFGIGGAIIADSDPYDEFEETLVKASVPHFCFNDIKGDM